MSAPDRLGAGRYIAAAERPAATVTTVARADHVRRRDGRRRAGDGAGRAHGRRADAPAPGRHPPRRSSPSCSPRGCAVWTQGSRSVNNDLALVHEQALLDVGGRAMVFLRERGFDHVVTLGHSGGGPLYAFYLQQAGLAPADRIAATPAGRPVALAEAELPPADGAVFLAPHPGQGTLLARLHRPVRRRRGRPALGRPRAGPFDPANGFAEPPGESSSYAPEFLDRYRAAQRDRIARIDARAREASAEAPAARAAFKAAGDPRRPAAALAPRSSRSSAPTPTRASSTCRIDPNERPYGSLFGTPARPDQLRPGRLRPADDARRLAVHLVGADTTNADFLALRPGRHRRRRCSWSSPATRPLPADSGR